MASKKDNTDKAIKLIDYFTAVNLTREQYAAIKAVIKVFEELK